jgi:hypothetical protein
LSVRPSICSFSDNEKLLIVRVSSGSSGGIRSAVR